MPRVDLIAAGAQGFERGELDRAARMGRQPLRGRTFRRTASELPRNEREQRFLLCARVTQDSFRRTAAAQQSQQQMLAADVTVPQLSRRLLCAAQRLLRRGRELFAVHFSVSPSPLDKAIFSVLRGN